MKKMISLFMSVALMAVLFITPTSAVPTAYDQPFASGTEGSESFRIPALLTLNNGSVIAAADMRYSHGADSPANLDTLIAVSEDGLTDWQYNRVNYFDDYADGTTAAESASFIDTSLVQSAETGRVFMLTDAFPSGMGCRQAKKGTGFSADGKNLLLSRKLNSTLSCNYNYYVAEFDGEFAAICDKNGATDYTVDREYNLYRAGEPLYTAQINSDKQIQQNIFYASAELHVFPTCYLWLRYSDDNGKTWSHPQILNPQVRRKGEAFLGVCPGRGLVTQTDGGERIIFTVYDHTSVAEHTRTIYSDDNGITWKSGEPVAARAAIRKTSESQLVTLPNGNIKMFSRNASSYISSSLSSDGGVTWTKSAAEVDLEGTANCMVSFINYSKKIDGRDVIFASYATDNKSRADGVIRTGLVAENGETEWSKTYRLTDGFFAYSCLTELSDGRLACLYEDGAAHITYKVFDVSPSGELSEINGDNCAYEKAPTAVGKLTEFFRKIAFFLKML